MAIRDAIVLTFFLASLPVCFFRPFYGILLWTVVAFLNPHRFAWGMAQSFPLALAVTIPTLAGFLIFSRNVKGLASPRVFLLVALWLWFTFTSIISTHTPDFVHHSADTWERWEFVSKVLLMTLVTVCIVDNFARLRMLVLVIAGCFGFFVAKAFPFIIVTGGIYRLYGPEESMIADNNDFGLALNMTLPLFFFLAQAESNRWLKRLFGFLFVITIPAVFFTYSRGALVGLIAVMGLMLLRLKQRFVLIPVIAVAVLVGVMFAPPAWQERMNLTSSKVVDGSTVVDGSALQRLNAWTFSWDLAKDFPIAGGGFATFTPELFSRYDLAAGSIHGPHSIYFGLLAEHGFIGLGLYLALVFSCFSCARRLVKNARSYGDPAMAHYANMFRFSITAFLITGVFLGRAYFDYFFTLVACLVVLERVARERWAQASAEEGDEVSVEPGREEALLDHGVAS